MSSVYSQLCRGEISGLPILHHHDYVSDLPPRHRFAMKKFHGVMKFLRRDNVVSMKQVRTLEHHSSILPKNILAAYKINRKCIRCFRNMFFSVFEQNLLFYGVFTLPDSYADSYSDSDSGNMQKGYTGTDSDSDSDAKLL